MTHRIVSLLPSATEIVSALGFQDRLVGRSHECDFPLGVERLPVCTEPKLDPRGSSAEIHARVDALLRDALAVYRVHADLLRELAPTHVVTQTQCDVCAVSLDDVTAALAEWTGDRPALVALNPGCLEEVFADVQRVADALDASDRGRALTDDLRARMGAVADRAATLPGRPRVACIEWLAPLMAAGNWVPELVEMAGGEDVLGVAGEHSGWITWDDLLAADPDVILIFPCGFDLARVEGELHLLTGAPEWRELRAVREGRVYPAEGNQYFNRPGPRLAETLEILAEILHPDAFDFGHAGTAWRRVGGPAV